MPSRQITSAKEPHGDTLRSNTLRYPSELFGVSSLSSCSHLFQKKVFLGLKAQITINLQRFPTLLTFYYKGPVALWRLFEKSALGDGRGVSESRGVSPALRVLRTWRTETRRGFDGSGGRRCRCFVSISWPVRKSRKAAVRKKNKTFWIQSFDLSSLRTVPSQAPVLKENDLPFRPFKRTISMLTISVPSNNLF